RRFARKIIAERPYWVGYVRLRVTSALRQAALRVGPGFRRGDTCSVAGAHGFDLPVHVIARSGATKQSRGGWLRSVRPLDCFAPLAMTERSRGLRSVLRQAALRVGP